MDLEELYQYMELALLKNIAKRLGNGKDIGSLEPLQWQIAKIAEMGELNRAQRSIIAEYARLTEKTVVDFVGDIAQDTLQDLDSAAKASKALGEAVVSRIELLQKEAVSTINLLNAGLLERSNQVYRDIVTLSAIEMASGTKSISKAISDSVSAIAGKGIPALTDKAGRRWSLEAYVRMLMQGTQKNVARVVKQERMDDLEIDLVYVDGHAGSRPSHYEFQFKVYSRSGNSEKYPPLSDTGYGRPDGIEGINCRHRIHVYHEGITNLDKKREKFESTKEKNALQYALTQEQRKLERKVRADKKELELQKALGVDDDIIAAYRAKLRESQARSKAFADKYDGTIDGLNLRRRYDREKIAVSHRVNYAKAVDKMFQKGDNVIYEKEEIVEEMKTSPIGQKMLEFLERSQAEVILSNRRPLHTHRGSQNGNQITMYCSNIQSKRVAAQTLIHEMTHYWYHIGDCQHAEAVCFAMEKMHLLKRDYLTEDEWQQMVKLAVDNYTEYEWERGGYGDFKQFNFVKKESKNRE